MIKVNFYKWDQVSDTWETPGGHRELGEKIEETAIRELQEETGTKVFDIKPICIYSVAKDVCNNTKYPTETFGGLFFAQVSEVGELLNFEIEKIDFFMNYLKN